MSKVESTEIRKLHERQHCNHNIQKSNKSSVRSQQLIIVLVVEKTTTKSWDLIKKGQFLDMTHESKQRQLDYEDNKVRSQCLPQISEHFDHNDRISVLSLILPLFFT